MKIVHQALKHNTAAVIVAHNRPSGDAEPSSTDIKLTAHLLAALTLVDIPLLDHLMVERSQVVALA